MEWTGLGLSIGGKAILEDCSGSVMPGEMACILGPSGAGKSTLLNILAGRMNTSAKGLYFRGDVSCNGTRVDPVRVRSNIAYVMQEDSLPSWSTPRECLEMSAALRLRQPREEALRDVAGIIDALHLQSCADTYVGSQLVKGISGGEKKRTAVAVELITKPRMIFLDEPLSGLDSFAAWTVVQVLKELASNGCAVLCTIHQPSSEIFQSFSKLICLAKGHVVYCSAVSALAEHMERVGHPVPTHFNPADHILFFVQSQPGDTLVSFTQTWAEAEQKSTLPQIAELRGRAELSVAEAPRAVRRKSFFVQLSFLVRRELQQTFRNKIGLVMRFAVAGVMNVLFACIFSGIGGKNGTHQGIQSHFGAVCNIMIGTMFGNAQPLLLQFPAERPIFLREYAANMYGVVAYFLSKTLVELPITFLTALESWVIAYWIMDLQGNFLELTLISWALGLTAASTALFVSCSVANAQSAQELAPLLLVPQIIFSGIFIASNLIPAWLRWLQYACALKYAINLGCIVEFRAVPGGDEFLTNFDISKDRQWLYIVVMLGIFVGFRAVAMLNLARRAKFVF